MADSVELNSQFKIFPGQPITQLNTVNAEAFTTKVMRGKVKNNDVMAYVLNSQVPLRGDIMTTIRQIESFGQMQVYDAGAVEWDPKTGRRRMVVIVERPGGRRLFRSMKEQRDPMGEETLARLVLAPIVHALAQYAGRGITHTQIRPTNMFVREVGAGQVMLGEAVCGPPGYGQPAVFETIERSMCTPSGRGPGTIADDLYALGVSLLMITIGRNPVAAMRDEQITVSKLERGTYSTLVSDSRIPLNLIEVLRGLMIDDPRQRWTLEELEMWLQGRRQSPKQTNVPRRASRPIDFAGRAHWDTRTLAFSFSRNVPQAWAIIENGDLDRWLRRSMSDEDKAEAAAAAVEAATTSNRGGALEERVVARVVIALDPQSPIRYRGFGVMLDGLGGLLAQLVVEDKSPQPVVEIIQGQLPMHWMGSQPDGRIEFADLISSFENSRSSLERSMPGMGFERVLYDLNTGLPCLSPLVDFYHCTTGEDVLKALDILAARDSRPKDPFDRHIAAFLMARHKRLGDRTIGHTASGDPTVRYLAILSILAAVQEGGGPEQVPHLAAWISELLDPIVARYHNLYFRQEIKAEAVRIAAKGDLSRVHALIDDRKITARDEQDFKRAQTEFEKIKHEIDELRSEIQDRDNMAIGLGRQAAAVISSLAGMSAAFVAVFTMAL